MLKLTDLAARADFDIGSLHISPARRLIEGPGGSIRVEPIVMKVFMVLLEAGGRVVTRDELFGIAWGCVVVGEDSLNRAIGQVRRIAGEAAPGLIEIETIPRTGYRLTLTWLAGELPTIAVLPFANSGGNPDQQYFVEGMVDEIISALTRVRALLVISYESSAALNGKGTDAKQAAAQVGVRYILNGSVRRNGSHIRVSTKLVDTRHSVQIWSESFDYELKDIFELQDRIALEVAAAIEPSVHDAEVRRVAREPVDNLGAYDLYLRAAPLRATCRKAEVMEALDLLERALELDPNFGPALAQSAGCHSQVFENGWNGNGQWHRRQGLALADRALRHAGEDAAVLAQVANAVMDLDGNVAQAIALTGRAIAINPGCARAWFVSGLAHLLDDDPDVAVQHLQTAARLDPISAMNDVIRAHIGVGLFLKRDWEGALSAICATSHRTIRIHLTLAAIYGYLSMPQESQKEIALFRARSPLSVEDMIEAGIPQAASRMLLLEGIRLGRASRPSGPCLKNRGRRAASLQPYRSGSASPQSRELP